MGIIKTPDLYSCSISINGVTHLKKQIKYDIRSSSTKYRDQLKALIYKQIGDPESDSQMLQISSPALRVKEIKTPVLIIAGRKDEIVPYAQSDEMVKALRRAGKEFENMDLEHAPHYIFRYTDQKEEVLNKIEAFLAKYLSS